MQLFKRIILPILCLIVNFSAFQVVGQRIYQHPELQNVKNVVQQYFAAESSSSAKIARKVYHDIATFTYIDNKYIVINSYSILDYLEGLELNEGHYEYRILEVDTIDICGSLATVNCNMFCPSKGRKINDFLTLVKEDDSWKIIHRLSYKEYTSQLEQKISKTKRNRQRINLLLIDYMQSRRIHDSQTMEKMFHPHSDILHINASEKNINRFSLKNFIDFHSDQKNRRLKHHYRIHFVYLKGNIAVAKIRTRYKYLKTNFTEYVSLALINNQWQIVKKLSHQDVPTDKLVIL